jgi:hypothetical protein
MWDERSWLASEGADRERPGLRRPAARDRRHAGIEARQDLIVIIAKHEVDAVAASTPWSTISTLGIEPLPIAIAIG